MLRWGPKPNAAELHTFVAARFLWRWVVEWHLGEGDHLGECDDRC